MKITLLLLVVLGFISFSHAGCSTSLCFQRCSANKQLNVYIQPSTQSDAACDYLRASPNSCCLLSSNTVAGTTYQTWCCPDKAATITNIQNSGLSYLHVSSKRSVEVENSNQENG